VSLHQAPAAESVVRGGQQLAAMRPAIWFGLAALGIIGRLGLAWIGPANYDQQSYAIVVGILKHGGNVYAETARYNYGPAWMYLLWGADRVARAVDLPFAFIVRCGLTLADITIAVIIARVALTIGCDGRRAALAYLLSPVSILLTGLHGQFDDLAAVPLLIAVWLALRSKTPSRRWESWVLGTVTLIMKQIWAFSVWTLFVDRTPGRRAVAWIGLSSLAFVATFVPFLHGALGPIIDHVFLYGGLPGLYGMGLLTWYVGRPLFVVTMLALPCLARRLSLVDRMELAGVAFIALAPGASQQYLVIPIIFGSVRRRSYYWLFTAVATPFLLVALLYANPLGYLPAPPLWWPFWLVGLAWFIRLLGEAGLFASVRLARPQ
jgi:hypothetical protein